MFLHLLGFPCGDSGKEPTCQYRRHKRHRFNPWIRNIPRRRAQQPTLVFLPGEFHGQKSLAGYSPGLHRVRQVKQLSTHTCASSVACFSVFSFCLTYCLKSPSCTFQVCSPLMHSPPCEQVGPGPCEACRLRGLGASVLMSGPSPSEGQRCVQCCLGASVGLVWLWAAYLLVGGVVLLLRCKVQQEASGTVPC